MTNATMTETEVRALVAVREAYARGDVHPGTDGPFKGCTYYGGDGTYCAVGALLTMAGFTPDELRHLDELGTIGTIMIDDDPVAVKVQETFDRAGLGKAFLKRLQSAHDFATAWASKGPQAFAEAMSRRFYEKKPI